MALLADLIHESLIHTEKSNLVRAYCGPGAGRYRYLGRSRTAHANLASTTQTRQG